MYAIDFSLDGLDLNSSGYPYTSNGAGGAPHGQWNSTGGSTFDHTKNGFFQHTYI